jgi:transcriptional regulator with XRE-family HTH domain
MGFDQHTDTARLAGHLKSLRVERAWTLSDLETRSGVSRATLSRIENAEASPTAETLGKLGVAFELPISRLIAPLDDAFVPFIPEGQQAVWTDSETGYVRRVISPRAGALIFELIEGTLPPRTEITYARPPVPGQEHHLVLLAGALSLTLEGTEYSLKALDCLRYVLHGASRFSTGGEGARYILAIR